MNRFFDRWSHTHSWSALGAFPAVNVWEEGDQVFVEAELPGLDLKDLEIFVTGGRQLTIKGDRKPVAPEKGVWHRQERSYGRFNRSLTLPIAVYPQKEGDVVEKGHFKVT